MSQHDDPFGGPSYDPEDLFDRDPEPKQERSRALEDEQRVKDHRPDAGEADKKPDRKRSRGGKRSGDAPAPRPAPKPAAIPAAAAPPEAPSSDDGEQGDKPKRKRRRRRKRGGAGGEGAPQGDRAPQGERTQRTHDDEDDERDLPEPKPRHRGAKPQDDNDDLLDDPAFEAPGEPTEIFAGETFRSLGLRNSVLRGVHAAGFRRPTHIQAQIIPPILSGKDVLGQARTGAGKTAAFGLPMIHMAERGKAFQGLVLCPTRELAIQITAEIDELAANTPIHVAAIYGGQPIPVQVRKLEKGPEILVATPGRLMDMYEHRHLHFHNMRQVVLDEVDRMLDIGFRDDIRKILKNMQGDHQTVFVSATISEEIDSLARTFMRNPEKIVTTAGSLTVNTVEQHYLPVKPWDKKRLLAHLLTHEEPALTLVFCRTKRMVDDLAKYLKGKNISAQAIHGDLPQAKRNSVMQRFRSGELGVLVASDLAARGLDVEGISHVVNYDLPEDPEIYIHRIGRTARAGKNGVAWSFVTPGDGELLTNIEILANISIPVMEYPDFEPGDPPRQIREEQEHKERRLEKMRSVSRTNTPTVPAVKPEKVDLSKFPDGVVPTKLPPKLIQGRVNTARAHKLQMKNTPAED